MRIVGIVGSEKAKFTEETKARAKDLIKNLIRNFEIVSSGHCHLGGIDIWAEEIAREQNKKLLIYPPEKYSWEYYKKRNIAIAKVSDAVYCITVKSLPPSYTGMRFDKCYHCNTDEHVKSGGCWTVNYAKRLKKPTRVFVIQ